MSEAEYEAKHIRGVRVPMRDGVELAAAITRPDAEGQFPAIMSYHPYRGTMAAQPPESYRHLAQRGYVMVHFDVRGTGNSAGFTTDIYSPDEIQDGCDMVEWIAAQPWCDGNVGMWGISYPGVVCWQVAMHSPPHLKCIIVRSGCDDVYSEWTNPGGSPRPFMYQTYSPLMTTYNCGPPDLELCGDQWADIWNQHLEHNVPWGIGFITHRLNGPYWQSRSVRPDYDRVKCPVFVIGGWADWYATALLRAFSHLQVPKRALVGPWSHFWPEDGIPGPRIDGLRECQRWFDHWLKGIDTGLLDEPPVTLFIREYSPPASFILQDKGSWRCEKDWPLPRTQDTPMYLHPGGQLTPQPHAEEACDEYVYNPAVGVAAGLHGGGARPGWHLPADQRPDEALSLTYTTPPLEEDLEIVGNPLAHLYVSSSAEIAYFSAKLCDVAPDGTSLLINKGSLNATRRDSHEHPQALEPGKLYELEIEMLAVAYKFQAGHRLRLDLACADFQNAWPTPLPATNTIYYGTQRPSQIVLPVAPVQHPRLPEPNLQPSARPLPALEDIAKPQHTITHDLINQTTTTAFEDNRGSGVLRASFTVSARNPAEAVATASYHHDYSTPTLPVEIETQCTTTSDETTFRHLIQVQATVNGKPHFQKSWSVSVPREFD